MCPLPPIYILRCGRPIEARIPTEPYSILFVGGVRAGVDLVEIYIFPLPASQMRSDGGFSSNNKCTYYVACCDGARQSIASGP
jgi:hypothetical protein